MGVASLVIVSLSCKRRSCGRHQGTHGGAGGKHYGACVLYSEDMTPTSPHLNSTMRGAYGVESEAVKCDAASHSASQ